MFFYKKYSFEIIVDQASSSNEMFWYKRPADVAADPAAFGCTPTCAHISTHGAPYDMHACGCVTIDACMPICTDPHPYMPAYFHARIHAYTHARIHTCTHARMHACTHARMHTRARARTHTHKPCAHTYACAHTPMPHATPCHAALRRAAHAMRACTHAFYCARKTVQEAEAVGLFCRVDVV